MCYTKAGLIEVPLTDDEAFNATLERIARLGGGLIYRENAPRDDEPAKGDMRLALREGA